MSLNGNLKTIQGALAAIALVALPNVATAQDISQTDQVGGAGGSQFTELCNTGDFLRGLRVREADKIDAVQTYCGSLSDPIAALDLGPRRGGSGGRQIDLICPIGFAVVGFESRAARLVDALGIICFNPDEEILVRYGQVGGNGGSEFPDIFCEPTQLAVGAQGRAADKLDRFGLICAEE